MNVLDFSNNFPDEGNFKTKWKEIRGKRRVVCLYCGSKEHYSKSGKECCECRRRKDYQTNKTTHQSRLPFLYRFVVFHLLTSTKKSFLTKKLQRLVGHKYYELIWTLLYKLRVAIGKCDLEYGTLELDYDFFSTVENEKNKPCCLNEFCYKFNRWYLRQWQLDELLVTLVAYKK